MDPDGVRRSPVNVHVGITDVYPTAGFTRYGYTLWLNNRDRIASRARERWRQAKRTVIAQAGRCIATSSSRDGDKGMLAV